MRIDRIQIDSLASLRGQQPVLDLDSGDLGEAGLIAITGATGAGKSTILDAVCLALFDQTPRLRGKGSDPRELLSRGATSASAIVDLSLNDGQKWCAEWSVHRARNQPEGKLQPSRMRVTDRMTKETLAEGKRPVLALIEEHLGLDFEQFTGVILLAQGEFAKFLEASDADRSELLEKLTGTDIYSRLSRAAFEQHKQLAERAESLSQLASGLVLLPPEERRQKETELDELEPTLARLERQVSLWSSRIEWFDRLAELQGELRQYKDALAAARQQQGEAAEDIARLQLADRAASSASQLHALDHARDQVRETRAAQEQADRQLQQAQQAANESLEPLLASFLDLGRCRKALEAAAAQAGDLATVAPEDLERARQRLREVARHEQQLTTQQQRQQQLAEDLQERQQLHRETAAQHKAQIGHCQALDDRLEEWQERYQRAAGGQSRDSWVGRRSALERAREVRKDLERFDIGTLQEVAEDAQKQLRRARTDHAAAKALVSSAKDELDGHDRLLRMAIQGAELAQHRPLLSPGEPCPLCGSFDHPLADGEAREEERDVLRQAEQRASGLKAARRRAENEADEAAQELARRDSAAQLVEQRLEAAASTIDDGRSRWLELRLQLSDLPASPIELDTSQLLALLTEAEDRLETLDAMGLEEIEIRRQQEAARNERDRLERELAIAAERIDHLEQTSRETELETTLLQGTLEDSRQAAEQQIETLAAQSSSKPPANDDFDSFLDDLETKRHTWLRRAEQIRHLQDLFRHGTPRAVKLLPGLEDRLKSIQTAQGSAAARDGEGDGQRNIPALEQQLAGSLDDAEEQHSRQTLHRDRAQRAATNAAHAEQAHTEAHQRLQEHLETTPFDSIDALRQALLEASETERLRNRQQELSRALERASAGQDHGQKELERHQRAGVELAVSPDDVGDREALEQQVRDTHLQVHEYSERKMTLRVALEADDERRSERHDLDRRLQAAQVKRDRAARLQHLIGQKDGGKFRRFAQRLNLDQLLELANLRLDHLAPRYGLERQGDSLDLQVIDRDMADDRRPTSTLSGGESFLVSLSLALALADLRRGGLDLGTLFLDEGFGSLDQETLDSALSVLEQLQADQNTQILIISHVGALRERIAHRIDVTKKGGGRSALHTEIGDP